MIQSLIEWAKAALEKIFWWSILGFGAFAESMTVDQPVPYDVQLKKLFWWIINLIAWICAC